MREYEAIVAYLKATGTPHRVTSTVRPPRFAGDRSYHTIGCAADFAGPTPSRNSPQLLAIFAAFGPVESQLAELAYLGAPYNIKNGRRVRPYDKDNHVHVAVKPGTFLVAPPAPAPTPVEVVRPMYSPALTLEPIVADLACPTGGAWLLTASGAVYAFGGAPYLGAANGKPYFAGRTAARLNLVDGKYQIVATSGETYGPGF